MLPDRLRRISFPQSRGSATPGGGASPGGTRGTPPLDAESRILTLRDRASSRRPAHVAAANPVSARRRRSADAGRDSAVRAAGHEFPLAGTRRRRANAGPQPDAEALRHLFGFTAAEGDLARLLAQGATLADAAAALGKSLPTVRTQLRAPFAKTGARRQAELVQVLLGVGVDCGG